MAVAPIAALALGAGKSAGTAAITSAAITAGSGLAGAALSNRSQNKATRAQMDATDKALAFEREREATHAREHARAEAARQQAYEARERIRMALLKRYGVNVPAGRPDVRASGLTLGSLAGPRPARMLPSAPPAAAMVPPQGLTLRDLGSWSDWNRRI